jgi:predicted RNase H-like HicB family nuclease
MTDTYATAASQRDGLTYTAVLTAGADGWFLAQVPEVPEAISQGRTAEEARVNVEEALRLALNWRAAEGEQPPRPGGVTVSQVTVPQP